MLGRIVLHRIRQAINEQAQLENYKKLAYADSLTGLFNYTAFKYMKSRWPERTDWTYIVMDVNWLKQTNDQYGHRAGDELLCCAARCIREAFYRAEDCFRIGGDEFAVIAAATDEDAVKAAVETLRRLCAEWDAKEEYPVSIAVGYAMQAGRTMTADELFMEADAAMYQNKAEIDQRKASHSSCYLEFQQGQYHDKCWLDTSISISDEIWNSRHVSDLILEVIPEFDFYGMTIVTKVQWDNILTKSQSDGCTCKEIIAEAVPWAAKCFETNDVFTIIGM